jgi:hypothetical protein
MSYDEEQQKRSRVVVDTPSLRREVVHTETSRTPERSGLSTGTVAALVIGALALATIVFLFLRSNQQDAADTRTTTTTTTAATTAPTAPPPTIIQQPAPQQQQPPVIIQAPATAAPPTTIVVPQSSATTAPADSISGRASSSGTDDLTVQSNVDRKLQSDPTLSTLGITASVNNSKATLTGTVNSASVKRQVERAVQSVRGVRSVDNQIIVSGSAGDGNATSSPY